MTLRMALLIRPARAPALQTELLLMTPLRLPLVRSAAQHFASSLRMCLGTYGLLKKRRLRDPRAWWGQDDEDSTTRPRGPKVVVLLSGSAVSPSTDSHTAKAIEMQREPLRSPRHLGRLWRYSAEPPPDPLPQAVPGEPLLGHRLVCRGSEATDGGGARRQAR